MIEGVNGFFYAGVSIRFGSKVLLIKNAVREHWELPGGKVEKTDPTYIEAALREAREEIGLEIDGTPEWVLSTAAINDAPGAGITFGYSISKDGDLPPTPVLSDEHSEYGWFAVSDLPEGVNPHCMHAIRRWTYNDHDLGALMQSGEIIGPSTYFNQTYFPMRITGTGPALRMEGMQYTYRNPSDYLNEEFVERCNGLNILWEHPDSAFTNEETLSQRCIGNISYAYVKGDEVWGVGKITGDEAAAMLASGAYSTSPSIISVVKSDTNKGGARFTVEGQALHLDHLAVVHIGVWDKLSQPGGIASPLTLRPIPMAFLKRYEMSEPNNNTPPSTDDRVARLEDCVTSMQDSLTKFMDSMTAANAERDKREQEREHAAAQAKDNVVPPVGTNPPAAAAASSDNVVPPVAPSGDAAPPIAQNSDCELQTLREALSSKDSVISALQSQVTSLVNSMPRDLSDDDRTQLSVAQANADNVFLAFGKSAPNPVMGESPIPYRRRMAKELQSHSPRFRDVNLSQLDATSFAAIESEIYKDAVTAARSPTSNTGGELVPVKRKMFGGREIVEYRGPVEAFLRPFSEPAKKGRFSRQAVH